MSEFSQPPAKVWRFLGFEPHDAFAFDGMSKDWNGESKSAWRLADSP